MNKIPIFYYHSVAPIKNRAWIKSYLTFELRYFIDFLEYLNSQKYRFINLDEYFELRISSNLKTDKVICLTFDDGYLDNYVFVYPLLKKHKAKATIFVSPEFIQENEIVRPTLEDVWLNNTSESNLQYSGFVSWKELQIMENSGFIDIQSHTMTHTKYFVSDKIIGFHHPKADYLYPISNDYPKLKPYYILNEEFKTQLTYGTPFFEMKSSLIARKITPNPQFALEVISLLKDFNWEKYNFEKCYERIMPVYNSYKSGNSLIINIESQAEYEVRVKWEIGESKKILEAKLQKNISHICWPHGDYNEFCTAIAKNEGFKSSHIVLRKDEINKYEDRFDRTGSSVIMRNRTLSLWKAKYKLGSYQEKWPYNWISFLYSKLKYGK